MYKFIQHNSSPGPDWGGEGIEKRHRQTHSQKHRLTAKLRSGVLGSPTEAPQHPGSASCLFYRVEQREHSRMMRQGLRYTAEQGGRVSVYSWLKRTELAHLTRSRLCGRAVFRMQTSGVHRVGGYNGHFLHTLLTFPR